MGLVNRGVVRVDCDPAKIESTIVDQMKEYMSQLDNQVVPTEHIVEAIRFKYLGFPFEEVATQSALICSDERISTRMQDAMRWNFASKIGDAAKVLLIGFQDNHQKFYAFDPLMMEISTDFTTEFHSSNAGHNVEGFAAFKSNHTAFQNLQTLGHQISVNCSTNACSAECTSSIEAYVANARLVMWDWRQEVGMEMPAEAGRLGKMPLWTRSKTGPNSFQMIGNEIKDIPEKDGLFVDRLFYKSSNQPGLAKMNQQIFADGDIRANMDRL